MRAGSSRGLTQPRLPSDEAELGDYIADPKGKIPGNSMAFAGLEKPDDIADVVACIRKFSQS